MDTETRRHRENQVQMACPSNLAHHSQKFTMFEPYLRPEVQPNPVPRFSLCLCASVLKALPE
jgi:hypothetical protein